MKVKYLSAAILLAATTLLSSCGKEEADLVTQEEQIEISFSWWGNDDRNEYTIEAIEKFEELHPNITVDCSYAEWSGYQSRYTVEMISNTESDVMQINYAWLAEYSEDGSGYYDLNELTDYLQLDNFSDTDLEYGMRNGKLNAIPIALNTITSYYNKTLYDSYGLELPKTFDDLYAAAEKMSGDGVYPTSAVAKTAYVLAVSYAEQASGKQFMDMEGNIGFGEEEVKTMLECYCTLVDKNVMPQVENFDRLQIESGTYAGALAWISDAENYCTAAIDAGSDIQVGDYPLESDSATLSWYTKPATMYAISDNTDHPEEAAMLLDFLLNSEEMAELQGLEKGIPLSKAAREYLESSGKLTGVQYEAYQKMIEQQDSLSQMSPYFENTDIIDAFTSMCNEVYYEKKTSSAAAAELLTSFNSIMEAATSNN